MDYYPQSSTYITMAYSEVMTEQSFIDAIIDSFEGEEIIHKGKKYLAKSLLQLAMRFRPNNIATPQAPEELPASTKYDYDADGPPTAESIALDASTEFEEEPQAPKSKKVLPAKKKPRAKRKNKKPRKMTGYNIFIKKNNADIKTHCNVVDGVKVKFMTKAGELWKNMSADEQESYNQLAKEYNSKIQQAKTVETPPAVVPVISDFKELAGPYEETYVAGNLRKSFKTLEEAYTSLLSSTNAVGITKTKCGHFKLRAGYKKNHDNTDKDGNTTPPFVYKSPKSETSWVLKSAISSYDSNNPFTESNPFIRQETLSADV